MGIVRKHGPDEVMLLGPQAPVHSAWSPALHPHATTFHGIVLGGHSSIATHLFRSIWRKLRNLGLVAAS